ncbi:MAG TPA: PilC/PilY family type IV pilus protein [Methylibium sp.]|uniref:pilus assembly protein n=1 Tax=Methylibium sp. TaxID=2067992 RepID=UPI002DBC72A0|nr:PilC/PilY family type IV pilus protein [Methylibium sp.]HEU4460944.1 PilC/PilY family type IV pilus protein [Methylibium sp.]
MSTSQGTFHAQPAGRILGAWRSRALQLALPVLAGALVADAGAQTTLADGPIFAATSASVPSNVALALSVEWPTASRAAYPGVDDYSSARLYRGYFDAGKCYNYSYSATEAARHFRPAGLATNRTCTSANGWSGNFLNWAATQAIDPFRLVMTGGNRSTDTPTETILQKAFHSGQGALYPDKVLTDAATIAGATPFNWGTLRIRIQGAGFAMIFSGTSVAGDPATAIPYGSAATDVVQRYSASVRVRVCDGSGGAGGLESNCQPYGSNAKPEGLIQRYATRLRFSAFGYMNETGNQRDGGVMRARMKFVGPTQPVPGQPPIANPRQEWSPTTGVFEVHPDSADETASNGNYGSTALSSGVANYLNKFGQLLTGEYKGNDPVGELYYAATRYFKNLGNVPQWSAIGTTDPAEITRRLDGFPVITTWDDPIQYSCQRNFILGIGDIYTHADKNVPGNTNTSNEPAIPNFGADPLNAVAATNIVGQLQGLGTSYGTATNVSSGCCSTNGALMAGIAFHSNTSDIRPDDPADLIRTRNRQTIQTFWVDVLERAFEPSNQFYLAAKFGGLLPPAGTTLSYATPPTTIEDSWWTTTGETVGAGATSQPRPDNYFTAGDPDTMVSGLTRAFERINTLGASFTTSSAVAQPQVSGTAGNLSFAASYDADGWIGQLSANSLSFAPDGTPTQTNVWNASTTLAAQLAGGGWDTGRRVITRRPGFTTGGVPFRVANLSPAQLTALDTSYVAGNDSVAYVNYLRGDRSQERSAATPGLPYRQRRSLLGDIVGSNVVAIGAPSLPLSDATNPGYNQFKIDNANRPVMAYAGANDGMLHAFRGDGSVTEAGREVFAYVPNAVIPGPSTPSTPSVDGLAALGNPNYVHRNYVNSTPFITDIDVNRTWTNGTPPATAPAPAWRSILIGGLGKGGRSYYAIDVTSPTSATSEADAASRVLWEISPPGMGYTFGQPVVVKTRRYGWTVVLPSGYNTPAVDAANPAGRAYLFFVNPLTGALLETVAVGTGGSATNDAGLAHINAYVLDFTDGYADAIYGADLLGNLWRVDVSGTGPFPAPATPIARLTDTAGNPQPVTTRPRIVLHPLTRDRIVTIGTGRLLDSSDLASTQQQTFYAIRDGNQARFFSPRPATGGTSMPPELPATVTGFPITRVADLVAVSEAQLATGITLTDDAPMGWYHDLGFANGAGTVARRVLVDSAVFQGTVAFASTLPSVSDPCEPSGTSRVYATNLGTARSQLAQQAAFYPLASGSVNNLQFLSVGGSVRLVGGTDRGGLEPVPGPTAAPVELRRLNWREIPLTN